MMPQIASKKNFSEKPKASEQKHPIQKLLRFARIYGPVRAITKAIARSRMPIPSLLSMFPKASKVGVIGCGQFAFSTIAYFLNRSHQIVGCIDVDESAAKSFSKRYLCKSYESGSQFFANAYDAVFIASNHASHTAYAILAMQSGIKKIYVEKPVSVSKEQLLELEAHRVQYGCELFSGYNRPHSRAVRLIRNSVHETDLTGPLTLNCFVGGHVISSDHWYRNPCEGTRVCGNIGHWIDLAIHTFFWRPELPQKIEIQIAVSNLSEPDDNLCITMKTDAHDLIVITITSRTEPFEGIYEIVNFQQGDVIANIDDFRRLKILRREKKIEKRFFPKDVGHRSALAQPFSRESRSWQESVVSSLLMLQIMDMVKEGRMKCNIDLPQLIQSFEAERDQRVVELTAETSAQ